MNHSSSINVHTTVCLIGGMGDNFFFFVWRWILEGSQNRTFWATLLKKLDDFFGEFLFNQLFAPLSNWMNTLISYCAVCRNFLAVLLNMHYFFPLVLLSFNQNDHQCARIILLWLFLLSSTHTYGIFENRREKERTI